MATKGVEKREPSQDAPSDPDRGTGDGQKYVVNDPPGTGWVRHLEETPANGALQHDSPANLREAKSLQLPDIGFIIKVCGSLLHGGPVAR